MATAPTDSLITADQAGRLCTTTRSPDGVAGSSYRRYVARLGAPAAVCRDDETGAKLYDRDSVLQWHASRPGQGARTDRATRPGPR